MKVINHQEVTRTPPLVTHKQRFVEVIWKPERFKIWLNLCSWEGETRQQGKKVYFRSKGKDIAYVIHNPDGTRRLFVTEFNTRGEDQHK